MKKSWEWWRRGKNSPRLRKEVFFLQSPLQEKKPVTFSDSMIDLAAQRSPQLARHFFHSRQEGNLPIGGSFSFPCALRFSTRQSFGSRTEDEDEDTDIELLEDFGMLCDFGEWEDEDDSDPEMDDGGDGGGINLGDVAWGERALSLANEVLLRDFGVDFKLFGFKISPKGYIYIRLDKLSNRFGCPDMEEIEKFSRLYDECLKESGERGEIPKDLGLEVSSPGAERLLKVPDDLERFREVPLVVDYKVDNDERSTRCLGYFLLDAVEPESRLAVWKLADVKENRTGKGRPFNRQQRDWRLKLPFHLIASVRLYVP